MEFSTTRVLPLVWADIAEVWERVDKTVDSIILPALSAAALFA